MASIDCAQASAFNFRPKLAFLSMLTLATFFALPADSITSRPSLPFRALFMPVPVAAQAAVLNDIEPVRAVAPSPSVFAQEAAMSPAQLLNRWNPFITEAARRFGVPKSWVRAVISRESGGRTMAGKNTPIVSDAGAVGVMQVMPGTYAEMRAQLHLGADASDPHDNIIAGTAYLAWLHRRYGFPDMFAAYNFGPGNFEKFRSGNLSLPAETVSYLASMKGLDSERRAKNRSRSA